MNVSPTLHTETIEFPSLGVQIPAYVAKPASPAPCPVVVVIQEVFGVNEHIREVSDRLAAAGYCAVAPHIYHRQAPGFEVGYTEADLALGRRYKEGTTAPELLADIQGAIAYLHRQGWQRGTQAGCIGFCFGGHGAYLAATLPEIKATASFYGAGIPHFTPGGGAPTLNRTPEIQGTLYGFFGTADPLIPLADVDAIEAALKAAGVRHQVVRYGGAGHGFFCDRRYSYDPQAASDAWDRVLALFCEELS